MSGNDMLAENEKQANAVAAKVMRVTFIIFTLIYILSCVIYNLLGVYTLQQSNVINRQVIDTCYLMPIMVYLFFYKIGFTPIYILSFGLMLLGAIFTCEIIPLPHNNKDNLEESVQKMNAKEAFIQ